MFKRISIDHRIGNQSHSNRKIRIPFRKEKVYFLENFLTYFKNASSETVKGEDTYYIFIKEEKDQLNKRLIDFLI